MCNSTEPNRNIENARAVKNSVQVRIWSPNTQRPALSVLRISSARTLVHWARFHLDPLGFEPTSLMEALLR